MQRKNASGAFILSHHIENGCIELHHENVEKIYPEAISIFIMPPSFEELEKRIRNRNTDSEEVIKERLEIAKDEIKCKDKYDYVVINNTVDKAVESSLTARKFL